MFIIYWGDGSKLQGWMAAGSVEELLEELGRIEHRPGRIRVWEWRGRGSKPLVYEGEFNPGEAC